MRPCRSVAVLHTRQRRQSHGPNVKIKAEIEPKLFPLIVQPTSYLLQPAISHSKVQVDCVSGVIMEGLPVFVSANAHGLMGWIQIRQEETHTHTHTWFI